MFRPVEPLARLFLTACLAMLVSAAAQEEDTSGIAVSVAFFLLVLHAMRLTRLSLLLLQDAIAGTWEEKVRAQ